MTYILEMENGTEGRSYMVTVEVIVPTTIDEYDAENEIIDMVENELSGAGLEILDSDGEAIECEVGAIGTIDETLISDGLTYREQRTAK